MERGIDGRAPARFFEAAGVRSAFASPRGTLDLSEGASAADARARAHAAATADRIRECCFVGLLQSGTAGAVIDADAPLDGAALASGFDLAGVGVATL